jgi:hypothetical protein
MLIHYEYSLYFIFNILYFCLDLIFSYIFCLNLIHICICVYFNIVNINSHNPQKYKVCIVLRHIYSIRSGKITSLINLVSSTMSFSNFTAFLISIYFFLMRFYISQSYCTITHQDFTIIIKVSIFQNIKKAIASYFFY